jgi:hypothetical protein
MPALPDLTEECYWYIGIFVISLVLYISWAFGFFFTSLMIYISWVLSYDLGSPKAGAFAIVLTLVSTLAAKFYMHYRHGAAAVEETKEYKHDSRTQLNEVNLTFSLFHYSCTYFHSLQAEYSTLIIATIAASLILSELFKEKFSKTNFSCPFMMLAIGNYFYFWPRIISRETTIGAPGASVRFLGLLWITYLIGKEF